MRFGILGLGLLVTMAACSGGGGTYISGPGANGNSDNSGDPNAAQSGTTPGDEGTTVPKTVTSKLASDVSISEVAVFQAIKASVMKDGKEASPSVPIVAARDALVRVYAKPSSDYTARSLKAVLQLLDSDGKPLKAFSDTRKLTGASTDAAPESTFNFNVPGQYLPLGVQFVVSITDENADPVADGTDSKARYPSDGSAIDLGVKSAGPSLKIVIVPVKYAADGSGRLPDTTSTQVKIDRDLTWSMYPVPDVEITVRSQPFVWNNAVRGSGQGWSELLQALADLRDQDGVADDVYYWGAFAAASSQQAFCGSGCVMGLSTVVSDPKEAYFRASIGVGYHGQDSAETMAHEIGHAHGRNHAPCSDFGSIDGVDPNFPSAGHTDATLGSWGYDLINQQLIAPSDAHDLMSYCQPVWVSDYTYKALFDRLAIVNKGKSPQPTNPGSNSGSGSGARTAYQYVTIDADGPASFGRHVTPRTAPHGEAREVSLLDAKGHVQKVVRGEFFGFDHLPGGLLMVPESGVAYSGVRVSGYSRTLTR